MAFPMPDVPPVTAAPTPAAPQTWREFQASRMGEYMKTEGGHAGAMKRIGAEWRAYKSGAVADTAASAASAADEGGDLLAQLAATKSKLDAGEAFGGMAQRRPVVDEIHEATAELDPEAAAIVNAAKAHEAAAEKIRSRFTIRDRNGTHRVEIPEMADMTLGRVKQAYTVANDAEKAAILETIDPERAKALTEIVEGRATFDKWYKNKNHWYEDPTYQAIPERPGPAPDDLAIDFADDALPGWGDRDGGWLRKVGWGWGPLLFGLVVLPWAMAITVATDGAARRGRLTLIRHLLDQIPERQVPEIHIDFPPLGHEPLRERFDTPFKPIAAAK